MNIDNYKLQRAYNILYLLKSNFLFDDELNCFVGAFDNCREQGLSLNFYFSNNIKTEFIFLVAENRNSDDIVIYWQEKGFDRAFCKDGVMTKKMWKNREYFKNEFEAAKKIAEIVKG